MPMLVHGVRFRRVLRRAVVVPALAAAAVALALNAEVALLAARGRAADDPDRPGWPLAAGSIALTAALGLLLGLHVRRELRRVSETHDETLRAADGALHTAEEALRSREEFLAVASHELKTPLTALRLLLGSALRSLGAEASAAPGRLAERVRAADRQAERLGHLVVGLLDASRAGDAGALRLDDVDLDDLARDEVARARALLARAGSEAAVRAGGPVVGRWDRERLRQAMRHLISNAAKYGSGRPVEVRVEGTETLARVSVQDHGIGIEPDRQERIFERFERGVSLDHYGGFGLGLWVVRRAAAAMGGTVSVESRPGEGSVFTLELPRAEPGPARR